MTPEKQREPPWDDRPDKSSARWRWCLDEYDALVKRAKAAELLAEALRRRGVILLNNLSSNDLDRLSLQDRQSVFRIPHLIAADIVALEENYGD